MITAVARQHTRWCLVATAAMLVAAFALHDASAQVGGPGRPPPGFPGGPGLSGAAGLSGVSGMPGFPGGAGFSGAPGGAGFTGISGMPGAGATGLSGGAGFSGLHGGFGGGGSTTIYTCSKCGAQVGRFDRRCPRCGVTFIGTVPGPGGPSIGPGGLGGPPGGAGAFGAPAPGGVPPGAIPPGGTPPDAIAPAPQPPPATNRPREPHQMPPAFPPPFGGQAPPGNISNTEQSGSKDADDSGLSTKVVVGGGIAALGLFALIAGAIIVMGSQASSQGGKSSRKRPQRRPGRFREDDYD